MHIERIPFAEVPQFSGRDVAYATRQAELRPFYQYEPTLEAFAEVFKDRERQATDRETLVAILRAQYEQLGHLPEAVAHQIDALGRPNTFTVVTAHQPSLFTGPLFFIYKVASTINLARRLNETYPDRHVVPVFVSGGEDHDFEEINHTYLFGKRVTWENDEHGSVGQMSTATLADALAQLKDILGDSEDAQKLYARVERAYRGHERYGIATLALVNDLFGEQGLVVLDTNRPELKRLFLPIMREELLEQPSQAFVERAQTALEKLGYSGQAYAREINLFYLRPGLRERIVREGDRYRVLNTDYTFTRQELIAELEAHPEHFSPNVILRPLYQECVLPNLAYIGGGGELAYWLERKEQFAHFGLNFPVLIRRNSVLWIDRSSAERMDKLGLTVRDLLEDTEALVKRFVRAHTENELSLTEEKQQLEGLFQSIAAKARDVDPTLEKAVLAEHARQLKTVEGLEGRLMRAEKQRHETEIKQIRALKERLFPGNGLQERQENFLPFYLRYGEAFLELLIRELDPLEDGLIAVVDK